MPKTKYKVNVHCNHTVNTWFVDPANLSKFVQEAIIIPGFLGLEVIDITQWELDQIDNAEPAIQAFVDAGVPTILDFIISSRKS